MPAGDEVAREGVVVLSAPGPFSLGYLPFVRAVAGTPAPARMLRLANGTAPLTVTRLDDRTLDVAADGASLAEIEGPMVRTAAHGLVPGQRIDVALASILVEAVDARGLPTRARFRFRAPFGSPGMSLLEWHGARFVPWRPPAIGETARFAPLSLVPE